MIPASPFPANLVLPAGAEVCDASQLGAQVSVSFLLRQYTLIFTSLLYITQSRSKRLIYTILFAVPSNYIYTSFVSRQIRVLPTITPSCTPQSLR